MPSPHSCSRTPLSACWRRDSSATLGKFAAGELAAFCLAGKHAPTAVRNGPGLLADFQARLTAAGIPLAWPKA